MNIEVANRLQQLRKAKGLSQEELANILGLSRQAISKWERAETSPDTDNLICLARLYNISIDKLLDTSESMEEIKERIAQERIDEISNKEDIKEDNIDDIKDDINDDINDDIKEDAKKTLKEEDLGDTFAKIFNPNHDDSGVTFSEKEKKLRNKKDDIIVELVVTTIVAGAVACIPVQSYDPNWWKWMWIVFAVPFCLIASFNNVFKNPVSCVTPLIFGAILYAVGLSIALNNSTDVDDYEVVVSIILILIISHIILNKVLLIVLYFRNKKDMDLIMYKEKIIELKSAHKAEISRILEEQKKSQ